ncbi:2OG-Fe(II) oxygenase [Pelomonas cellulosilytica]|uniref:2OG-Fe(II) oxygenase n=1 Tax=Pelomonas cellulosilytica TaxID=2906762 RepID=UPI003B019C4A
MLDSENSGHFRAHRDNTTRGTAHRRFALSVNLNNDFDGGELCFPEYAPRTYKMPAGSAIVFSGSLLHSVSPVRRGRRYAFLPFLYDDAAAARRSGAVRRSVCGSCAADPSQASFEAWPPSCRSALQLSCAVREHPSEASSVCSLTIHLFAREAVQTLEQP